MTNVLVTIDTELSALLHQRGANPGDNLASSILGRCAKGDFGVRWQMDRLDGQGLKGVFFVDPFPALVYGAQIIADIVAPIVERNHEVQLHIHTEWLEWATQRPVGGRQGRNIGDFGLTDQMTLLGLATELLVGAGAPRPIAFRAGNFGANDDTLSALHRLGLRFDSSVNAAYLGGACRIDCAPSQIDPICLEGVVELPVSGLLDRPGHVRAAQVCALSKWEMQAALDHAAGQQHAVFVAVTHSFEMLSRDRQRPNRQVMGRFEALCRAIARDPVLRSVGFADLDVPIAHSASPQSEHLRPNALRTALRIAEQAIGTWRYEHRLRPA